MREPLGEACFDPVKSLEIQTRNIELHQIIYNIHLEKLHFEEKCKKLEESRDNDDRRMRLEITKELFEQRRQREKNIEMKYQEREMVLNKKFEKVLEEHKKSKIKDIEKTKKEFILKTPYYKEIKKSFDDELKKIRQTLLLKEERDKEYMEVAREKEIVKIRDELTKQLAKLYSTGYDLSKQSSKSAWVANMKEGTNAVFGRYGISSSLCEMQISETEKCEFQKEVKGMLRSSSGYSKDSKDFLDEKCKQIQQVLDNIGVFNRKQTRRDVMAIFEEIGEKLCMLSGVLNKLCSIEDLSVDETPK